MSTDDLKKAIDTGDVQAVRAVVTSEPDLVSREIPWDEGCGGDTSEPISYVSLAHFHGLSDHQRMGEIARVLLAAGAPVEGAADSEETPIVTAASYDQADVASVLAEAGADLEGRGHAAPGGTALAHAVYFGNPAAVDVLVRAGAQPRTLAEAAGAGDLSGWPLEGRGAEELAWGLRGAALCERLGVIDELLAAGADIHAETERGPALQWAAWAGKAAAVRHLVEHGADPALRDREHHGTPLGWCRHRNSGLFRHSPGHDAVEAYLEPRQAAEDRS